MRSKVVTLTSLHNKNLLVLQAWENQTCSTAYAVHVERDSVGKVLMKSKGATSRHPNFSDAVHAMNRLVDEAVAEGWRFPKRVPPPPRPKKTRPTRQHPPAAAPEPADWADAKFNDVDSAAKAIVDAGFRALAKVHHPDLGGNAATMSVLSETRRQLREMLELVKK